MTHGDVEMNEIKEDLSLKLDESIVWNRYVLFLCFTYELVIISQVGNLAFMIFAGASPDVIGCDKHSFAENITHKQSCEIYEMTLLQTNHSCTPQIRYQFKSVNVEWNLLCDQERAVKNSISFQMFGVMIGTIAFAQLSDLFGRKPIALWCVIGTVVSGALSSFTHSIFSFTLFRFIVGLFVGGNSTVMYVYVIENIPTNIRFKVKTFVNWSPNFVALSVLAYFIGEWRTLSLAMNLLASLSIICFLFLYESPRWLMAKGRVDETAIVLKRISGWGQVDVKQKNLEPLKNNEISEVAELMLKERSSDSNSTRYYFCDLFSSVELIRYTLIVSLIGIISNSLMFNLERISGSLYINTSIIGIFRYAFNMVIALMDHKLRWMGRKAIHSIAIIGITVSMLVVLIINYHDVGVQYKMVIRTFTLLSIGLTATVMLVNTITNAELFPTAIRNLSSAHILTWSHLGSVVAPQIFYLSAIQSALPYVLIISMTVLDMILFGWLLPETKNKPLNDVMPPSSDRNCFHKPNSLNCCSFSQCSCRCLENKNKTNEDD